MKIEHALERLAEGRVAARGAGVDLQQRRRRGLAGDPGDQRIRRDAQLARAKAP